MGNYHSIISLGFVVIFLFLVGALYLLYLKTKLDKITDIKCGEGNLCVHIKYCSGVRFNKFRFNEWDGVGCVEFTSDKIRLILDGCTDTDLSDNFSVEWIGVKFPKNGTYPWIKLIINKEVYYVTANTNIFNVDIKNKTKEIFYKLIESA